MISRIYVSTVAQQSFHDLNLPGERSAHQMRISSFVFHIGRALSMQHYRSSPRQGKPRRKLLTQIA
jgi:hypothetical protein